MKSSAIELKLPLGASTRKCLDEMARKAKTTPNKLAAFFLEAGRTSPNKNFYKRGELRPPAAT